MSHADQSIINGWHILHECDVPPSERIPMIDRVMDGTEFYDSLGRGESYAANIAGSPAQHDLRMHPVGGRINNHLCEEAGVAPCPRETNDNRIEM